MSFDPNKPYNKLPLLPPEKDIESKEILKKALNASDALAELKGLANSIPNPAILINSIILREAKSSSEIENIITTDDDLYKAFSSKTKNVNPATKEVLSYREALWFGFNELKKLPLLTTNLFESIYRKIINTSAGIRKTPGTKLVNNKGKTIYTPPEGERLIRDLLANLEKYIHEEHQDVNPLIKSAIIHYQFESIHPFTDGNGRTGRIIIILYFILTNKLNLPILYLSRYIIQNKSDYYKLLLNVTVKNEWEKWILYVLDGIEQTSKYTIRLIEQILALLKLTTDIVNKKKKSPVPKEVIELIFENPYCKTEHIVKRGIAGRKAAERYLKELVRLNILFPEKVGKEVIYINRKLFDILSS